MRKALTLLTVLFLSLSACTPAAATVDPGEVETRVAATLAHQPTQTPLPSPTPLPPTDTPQPTTTSTDTPSPSPTASFTPDFTPTHTLTPTATLDPLYAPHGPGFYLVGIDIATGIWRSDPTLTNRDCYWSITKVDGDIIRNHFGMAGGTMYIPAHAFEVEMSAECGTWTYLGEK